MPAAYGRYLTQLRELWRLPHHLDVIKEQVCSAIVDRLDAAHHLRRSEFDQTTAAIARIEDLLRRMPTSEMLEEMRAQAAQSEALRHDIHRLSADFRAAGATALGAQRTRLRERHGTLDIATDHPVAYLSPDHLTPWGTAQDNSRSDAFNARLISLVPSTHLSLLDLGCSGGGAVRSMIELGYLAAGVEGSDYSQKRLRAEWATIPDHLFTADITKSFQIVSDIAPDGVRFGIVTMWEVIEHIAEADLPALFTNVDAHLSRGGIVILSVSPNSDVIDGRELHQTIHPRPWWADKFATLGWSDNPRIVAWFGDDLVRWEANATNSFHFALSRASETPVLTRRSQHLLAGVGAAQRQR